MASFFPRTMENQQIEGLGAEVSEEELKSVLYSFKEAKGPGPNGWTTEFYCGFYEFLEEELLRVIKESRVSEKALGNLMQPLLP